MYLTTVVNLVAGTTNTNRMAVAYAKMVYELNAKKQDDNFWSLYRQEIEKNGQEISFDRFGGPSAFNWTRKINKENYEIHQRVINTGRDVFIDTALDSLRESVVALPNLSIDYWEDFEQKSFFRFLSGSIGNTTEERLDPTSASPSTATIGNSRWQRTRKTNILRYGIRPWDGYSYIDADIGRLGEKPILRSNFRIVTPLDDRIGMVRIQEQIIIPFTDQSQLVIGGSFDPTKFNSSDRPPVFSARLEHILKKSRIPGVIYASVKSGPYEGHQEVLTSVGFFAPWPDSVNWFRSIF